MLGSWSVPGPSFVVHRGTRTKDQERRTDQEPGTKHQELLYEFFRRELVKFLEPDLDPKGREIIQCCLDGGSVGDYINLIPTTF